LGRDLRPPVSPDPDPQLAPVSQRHDRAGSRVVAGPDLYVDQMVPGSARLAAVVEHPPVVAWIPLDID